MSAPTSDVTLCPAVNFVLSWHQLADMRVVLDRAMNTWEPGKQPPWLAHFSAQIDQCLGRLNEPPEGALGQLR